MSSAQCSPSGLSNVQLYRALIGNDVTHSFFDGIYAYDTLPDIEGKPLLIVSNTNDSTSSGEHWLLFFFCDNTVDFYDSLGKPLEFYGENFINLVELFSPQYNFVSVCTQLKNTNTCGVYCLYVALFLCGRQSLMSTIENMPKNYMDVEHIVSNNFLMLFESCCTVFVQSCCIK